MKNSLTDLNNHLFSQLERLGNEDLNDEQLGKEIQRSNAITGVAEQIIAKADLQLRAVKLKADNTRLADGELEPLLPASATSKRLLS